ncbi:MAG TPA: sulfur carrier protein ThiS [Bryobacteraceae bacterium]|nr:sulfur carrier protein ThiS [Bryobacteraceae bacterium]
MSTNLEIEVTINGEPRALPSGQTLGELLESLGLDPARVAVELDRRIVKQHDWDTTEVSGGARLEIVQFVGGG